MKTDIKTLLELAGCDVTQGKAKLLIEATEKKDSDQVKCPDCHGAGGYRQKYQGETEWDHCPTCDGKKTISKKRHDQEFGDVNESTVDLEAELKELQRELMNAKAGGNDDVVDQLKIDISEIKEKIKDEQSMNESQEEADNKAVLNRIGNKIGQFIMKTHAKGKDREAEEVAHAFHNADTLQSLSAAMEGSGLTVQKLIRQGLFDDEEEEILRNLK